MFLGWKSFLALIIMLQIPIVAMWTGSVIPVGPANPRATLLCGTLLMFVNSLAPALVTSDVLQSIKEEGPWKKGLGLGTYMLAFSGSVAGQVYLGIQKQEMGKPLAIDLYQFPADAFDDIKKDATKLVVRGSEQYKRMVLE